MKLKRILLLIVTIFCMNTKSTTQPIEKPSIWQNRIKVILASEELVRVKNSFFNVTNKLADKLENVFHVNDALSKDEQPDQMTVKIIEKIKTLPERVSHLFLFLGQLVTQSELETQAKELNMSTDTISKVEIDPALFDKFNPTAKIIEMPKIQTSTVEEVIKNTDSTVSSKIGQFFNWVAQNKKELGIITALTFGILAITEYEKYIDRKRMKKQKEKAGLVDTIIIIQ